MKENINNRRAFLKKSIGFVSIIGFTALITTTESCQKSTSGTYSISSSLCTGCKKCLAVCSVSAISISNDKASINSSKCIGCGHCARVCPQGAISQA